jgi:sterol O-acyltransferase
VFVVLHCFVLLMKQYSYADYNGWLSSTYLRRERLLRELAALEMEEDRTDLGRVDSLVAERERLRREIENMEKNLTGRVCYEMRYPNNLTFANFLDYMICPTLVYELEYPRTDKCVP